MFGGGAHGWSGIVGAHDDQVLLPRMPGTGHVQPEAREGALVLADMEAIDPDVGNVAYGGEVEILPHLRRGLGRIDP